MGAVGEEGAMVSVRGDRNIKIQKMTGISHWKGGRSRGKGSVRDLEGRQ